MKSLIMGTLVTIALGAGAFIVNGIDADTKKLQSDMELRRAESEARDVKLKEEYDTLKSLQATDYAELSTGQQAIRNDIAKVAEDRRIMDSLISGKLETLILRLGY